MFSGRTDDDLVEDKDSTDNKVEINLEGGNNENLTEAPPIGAVDPQLGAPPKSRRGLKKSSSNEPNQTNLADLKQQALASLTPLIDELDQNPSERFRTIMMLIQSGNDSSLLDKALASANEIADEKQKAQALLETINEINYQSQAGNS